MTATNDQPIEKPFGPHKVVDALNVKVGDVVFLEGDWHTVLDIQPPLVPTSARLPKPIAVDMRFADNRTYGFPADWEFPVAIQGPRVANESQPLERGDGDEPDYFAYEGGETPPGVAEKAAIHDAAALFAQLLRKAHNGNIKSSSKIWSDVAAMVERLDGLKK